MRFPAWWRQGAGTPDRVHGLDTLRAMAILMVMPYHLANHFPDALHPFTRFGWMGVDLFFVLSGYLIGWQVFRPTLQEQAPGLKAFYARRAYRILPAFFVVLLLYVAVPAWREAPGMQPWWQFATFTVNLLIDYGRNHAFSHAWSLCVEEHFYLVLPVLTLVLWRRRPTAWTVYGLLLATLLVGVALRAWVLFHVLRPAGPDSDDFGVLVIEKLYYPTYVRLDGLLAGVCLALLRAYRPTWWAALLRRGHSLALGGVALVFLAGWCMNTRFEAVTGRAMFGDLFGYPLLALGFGLLVASAISRNGLLAGVRVPGATLLATLAFSLYLTHKEAVNLLLLLFPNLPDQRYFMLPVYFGACLTVAALLYVLVERPFLRLRDRQAGKREPAAVLDVEARADPAL